MRSKTIDLIVGKELLRASLRWIALSCLVVVCVTQVGCAGTGNAIMIYDYAEDKIAGGIPMSNFREIVRTESSPNGCFFTMTEEKGQLIIRKRNIKGEEIARHDMPLVNTVWVEPQWCALDDAGERLAYHDRGEARLKLRNLKIGTVSDIPSPKIDSTVSMKLFDWVGPEKLILVRNRPDADYSVEISSIRTNGGGLRAKPIDLNWYPDPLLSPDGKWLCGVDGNERIAIHDVGSFDREIVIPAPGDNVRVRSLRWSADSEWLYYINRIIESNHRRLFRLNLATGKSEELPILPTLTKKPLIFRGCLGETIALSDGDFAWIFNAQTREWKRMGKCNGAVYGIRGTTCYAVTQ